jgi:hypothetical protein
MKVVPMMDYKSPLDKAPDWVDQTYYVRATNCLMMLDILGVISNKKHLFYLSKMEKWLKDNGI